jgi:Mg-chelatase subunit ChlD
LTGQQASANAAEKFWRNKNHNTIDQTCPHHSTAEHASTLKQEVLQMARIIRGIGGFKLLMLDTENKFVSTGMAKEIAAAAGGRYHYIPKATESSMAAVANQALASLM